MSGSGSHSPVSLADGGLTRRGRRASPSRPASSPSGPLPGRWLRRSPATWCGTAPTRCANHRRARLPSSSTSHTRLPVSLAPRSTRRHQLVRTRNPGPRQRRPWRGHGTTGRRRAQATRPPAISGRAARWRRISVVLTRDDVGHILQRSGAGVEIVRVCGDGCVLGRVGAHFGAAETRRMPRCGAEHAELGTASPGACSVKNCVWSRCRSRRPVDGHTGTSRHDDVRHGLIRRRPARPR